VKGEFGDPTEMKLEEENGEEGGSGYNSTW
jgi:hypothetical protein